MGEILDFKAEDGESNLFDGVSLLQILQAVPSDIHSEYLGFIDDYLEDLVVIKNVIASRDKPNLHKHLIQDISPNQSIRLRQIALSLAAKESERQVNDIVESTFSLIIPDEESLVRAPELVQKMKAVNISQADELARVSKYFRFLADSLIVLGYKNSYENKINFESLVHDRLAQMDRVDLDRLSDLIDSLTETNNIKLGKL